LILGVQRTSRTEPDAEGSDSSRITSPRARRGSSLPCKLANIAIAPRDPTRVGQCCKARYMIPGYGNLCLDAEDGMVSVLDGIGVEEVDRSLHGREHP
jgi:hypothetical protein